MYVCVCVCVCMCVCVCVWVWVWVCVCVCQTEAEQLLQSFYIPRGLKVNDSVAFHSPAGGYCMCTCVSSYLR